MRPNNKIYAKNEENNLNIEDNISEKSNRVRMLMIKAKDSDKIEVLAVISGLKGLLINNNFSKVEYNSKSNIRDLGLLLEINRSLSQLKMSTDSHNTISKRYLKKVSISIETTEYITDYSDTENLKRDIGLLDLLLA